MGSRAPKGHLTRTLCAVLLAAALGLAVCACAGMGAHPSIVAEVANAAGVVQVAAHLQRTDGYTSYVGDPQLFLSVPDSDDIATVNLNSGESTEVPASALPDVREALAAIDDNYSCGFVFVDLGTGRGFAYNAGKAMYIASAIKAPLAYYVVTHVDALDDEMRSYIEDALVYSDNDSFESFAYAFIDEGYGEWLEAHGVQHEAYLQDLYAPMSARCLACFWAEIAQFLQAGSSEALWFAEQLSSTNTSFIRDGLNGLDVNVLNKGGWIADEEFESVTDAGIIEADGRVYLMAIVTDQPDGGQTEAIVSNIARALFEARGQLQGKA